MVPEIETFWALKWQRAQRRHVFWSFRYLLKIYFSFKSSTFCDLKVWPGFWSDPHWFGFLDSYLDPHWDNKLDPDSHWIHNTGYTGYFKETAVPFWRQRPLRRLPIHHRNERTNVSDPHWSAVSGSRRAKITHKKDRKFHDLKCSSQIIVPDSGDIVRSGPPGFIAWRAGTTTLCLSKLYPPPVRD